MFKGQNFQWCFSCKNKSFIEQIVGKIYFELDRILNVPIDTSYTLFKHQTSSKYLLQMIYSTHDMYIHDILPQKLCLFKT